MTWEKFYEDFRDDGRRLVRRSWWAGLFGAFFYGLDHPATQNVLGWLFVEADVRAQQGYRWVRCEGMRLWNTVLLLVTATAIFALWPPLVSWVADPRLPHGQFSTTIWAWRFGLAFVCGLLVQLLLLQQFAFRLMSVVVFGLVSGGIINLDSFRAIDGLLRNVREDANRMTAPEVMEKVLGRVKDLIRERGVPFWGWVNFVIDSVATAGRFAAAWGGLYTVYAIVCVLLPFFAAPWFLFLCLCLLLAMCQMLVGFRKRAAAEGQPARRTAFAQTVIRLALWTVLVGSVLGLWGTWVINNVFHLLQYVPGVPHANGPLNDPAVQASLSESVKRWVEILRFIIFAGIMPWTLCEVLLAKSKAAGTVRVACLGWIALIILWYAYGQFWLASNAHLRILGWSVLLVFVGMSGGIIIKATTGKGSYGVVIGLPLVVGVMVAACFIFLGLMDRHRPLQSQLMYEPGGPRGTPVPTPAPPAPSTPAPQTTPKSAPSTSPPVRTAGRTPSKDDAVAYWRGRGFKPTPYDIALSQVFWTTGSEVELFFATQPVYVQPQDTVFVAVPEGHCNFDRYLRFRRTSLGGHCYLDASRDTVPTTKFRNPQDFPMPHRAAYLPLVKVGGKYGGLFPGGEVLKITGEEGRIQLRINHPSGYKVFWVFEKKSRVDERSYTNNVEGSYLYMILIRRHRRPQGQLAEVGQVGGSSHARAPVFLFF